MNPNRLLEQLDACPAGHPDALALELAEVRRELESSPGAVQAAQRIAQADRVLGRAMSDVPVPGDLEARLLAALEAASRHIDSREGTELSPSVSAESAVEVSAATVPAVELAGGLASSTANVGRLSRRAWLAGACGAGAAVAASATVAWWAWPRHEASPLAVEELTRTLDEKLEQRLLASTRASAELLQQLPLSAAINRNLGWQAAALSEFPEAGRTAVAYRATLNGRRGAHAVLFVAPFRGSLHDQPDWKRRRGPASSSLAGQTGASRVVVWVEPSASDPRQTLLYALLVHGGEGEFDSLYWRSIIRQENA